MQRTTGKVVIRPVSASASVTIKFDGTDGGCVSHTGGAWELWNINLQLDIRQASSMSYVSVISSSDSTGYVAMYHCPINVIDHTNGSSPTSARIISSSGHIRIYTVDNLNDNSSNVNWTRSGTGVDGFWWLRIENSGLIYMWRTSKEGAKTITVSGSFNAFVYSVNNGFLRYGGSGTGITFRGSCIGKEFTVHSGGSIDCDADSNSAHWFPGNANGTVNTSQASWINPPATYE